MSAYKIKTFLDDASKGEPNVFFYELAARVKFLIFNHILEIVYSPFRPVPAIERLPSFYPLIGRRWAANMGISTSCLKPGPH